MTSRPFIWETHGIHVGTGADHVKHGIDDLEEVVERAIALGFPALTFVIHTPRLTRFRYATERATEVKFIRGDASYFDFADRMARLRSLFEGRIQVRYGVELEWLGTDLGLQWNRAKLFQASGVDFVITSVHFAPNGIPYDGSRADTDELIRQRGGLEQFWSSYFDEVIEMVDATWQYTSVVGHLDLPKLYAPLPACLSDLDGTDSETARRLFTLLEMIAERNLAIDVNLSGIRKGVGIYPHPEIVRRARLLGIPVALGTDTHALADLGSDYARGLEYVKEAGYRYYVSFSRGIPEKRSLRERDETSFAILNVGMELLNHRFAREKRMEIPHLSFGGEFRELLADFPESTSLGSFHALRVRKEERSITISDRMPAYEGGEIVCLFSHHKDLPGTLAILLNTLASEEINVETAWLNALGDGTATAYLTLSGPRARIREAVEFVQGTGGDRFIRIDPEVRMHLPPLKPAPAYLLEVDGVWLPIPLSRQMIVAVHANKPGVVLVLLSALSSRGVNVVDLQLGARGDKNFAALGVEGDSRDVAEVLRRLGPTYYEASHIVLGRFDVTRKKVIAKQENSRMCFVCGLRNTAGLRAFFYELENGELMATFSPREEHQSYPGRLHGGVSATILDETIGRAILIRSKGEVWGVTAEFTMKFKKPVPLDKPLRAVGRIVKEGSRVFEGTGEILLEDGTVAVEGQGRYIKMPIEKIADFDRDQQDWKVVPAPGDPAEVETRDEAAAGHDAGHAAAGSAPSEP